MQFFQKNRKWMAIICGSLISSFSMAPLAIAATNIESKNNTLDLINELFDPGNPFFSAGFERFTFRPNLNEMRDWLNLSTVPMPEELLADATIAPVNGTVKVQLTNPTNAVISFEVVGHTEPRILLPRSSTTLKALPTPVTVTFRRQDGGLLSVQPQVSDLAGILQIAFDETTDLGIDRIAMKVESDGSILLN